MLSIESLLLFLDVLLISGLVALHGWRRPAPERTRGRFRTALPRPRH